MLAAKKELYDVIDLLDEEDAELLLKVARKFVVIKNDNYVEHEEVDKEELTGEEIKRVELGKEQIANGEFMTLEDYKRQIGL